MRRLYAIYFYLFISAALLVACIPIQAPPIETNQPPAVTQPDVVLWGDSFGVQVGPHLPYANHAFGGASPCHHINDVLATTPRVAIMVFVGNHQGPCDYAQTVAAITESLTSRGTHVVWVAAPPFSDYTDPTIHFPDPCFGPRDAIAHIPRGADGQHLSEYGAAVFAHAIKACVG